MLFVKKKEKERNNMYIKNRRIIELVRTISSDKRYYITSMEFAKILGKRHSNVTRDINQEIERLEEDGRNVDKLFILSEYTTTQNKILQSYRITANGLFHMIARYGRYSYKLRYDLIELADWLKSRSIFYDNDYYCFKRKINKNNKEEKNMKKIKSRRDAANRLEEILRKDYGFENRTEDDYATTLDLARILDKGHEVILEDVRRSVSKLSPEVIRFSKLKFEETRRIDEQNKSTPIINMNKDAFLHFISGIDDEIRGLIILSIFGS